jgi:hypothetical protein
MAFPLTSEKTSGVSSLLICEPGTLLTGASLTAFTVTAIESVSLLGPPRPLFPRSFVVIWTDAGPL